MHKATPGKRGRATEAIFDKGHREHQVSDAREEAVRMSMDTQAHLHVGAFSRGGTSRGSEAIHAWDHAMRPKATLVPGGILEVLGGLVPLIFGTSRDTRDVLADGLQPWWTLHKEPSRLLVPPGDRPGQRPAARQCADTVEAKDGGVCGPPCVGNRGGLCSAVPSQVPPIARCGGILEAPWTGTGLETVGTVLPWARTMSWHAVYPIVE